MISIQSPNNATLKRAIRLHDRRGRKQQNRIIIFGVAEISRALRSGIRFVELFCCEEFLSDKARELVQPSTRCADKVYLVNEDLFEKLAFGSRQDGLVAVSERPKTSLENWIPKENQKELVLVLESIEKPGNIGAIYRSGLAAGVTTVLHADPICDIFHPNAIRTSLGSIFSIPTYAGTSIEIKNRLDAVGIATAAAKVDGTIKYTDFDMTIGLAIAVGNESTGLSDIWSGKRIKPVIIPMKGDIDSLNVAMTATVMAFEASRQRSTKK